MIRYCPNADCSARRRTGRAAEYCEGVERCADCGADLVEENPTPTIPGPFWPGPLRRRLWVTGLGMAAAWLACLVPSPFLDTEVATGVLQTTWVRLNMQLGPFALGLVPVMSAFVLVELAALVVPRWNRRRHGDPKFRHTLLAWSLGVGALLAFVQAFFLAIWLESMGNSPAYYSLSSGLLAEPGLQFRVHFALTAAAATMLLALLALLLSRYGVGNGFAVLLVVDLLRTVPVALHDFVTVELLLHHSIAPGELLFAALLFAFLPAGILLAFVQRPRPTPSGLPLFLPVSGVLPIELAMPLLLFPTTLLSFVDLPWLRHVADATAPGTMTLLGVQLGAILVFVPLGSWLYWWRFRSRLGQPGHRRPWLAAQLWSAALLGGLVLVAHGLSRQGPAVLTKGVPLLWLLPLVVILVDLATEIRARRLAPGGADLVPLAEYQHPAEAWEDALGRPPEAGVVVQGLRFRTLHYFFAPQVPCRVLGVPQTPTAASNSESPAGNEKLTPDQIRRRWARRRVRRGWARGGYRLP